MTDERPLVSIGLPVYNGEKHICRALDSLLAQKYDNFEIIISDNASTDRTHDISQEYLGKDPRISYHRNDQNIGAIANFALVLEKARGEYFMWAACDDLWMPEFVGAMVDELEKNQDSSVSMSSLKRFSENGSLFDVVRYQGGSDPSRMSNFRLAMALASGRLYHFYIYGLYRIDFLRRAFKNYQQVIAADRLFVCQLALATRFSYVDSILHKRQVHDKPIAKRFSSEELGKISKGPLAIPYLKMSLSAGPYLWRSEVIPFRRKLLIPAVVINLFIHNSYAMSRKLVQFFIAEMKDRI